MMKLLSIAGCAPSWYGRICTVMLGRADISRILASCAAMTRHFPDHSVHRCLVENCCETRRVILVSAYDLTCRSAYDLTCWFAGSLAG